MERDCFEHEWWRVLPLEEKNLISNEIMGDIVSTSDMRSQVYKTSDSGHSMFEDRFPMDPRNCQIDDEFS